MKPTTDRYSLAFTLLFLTMAFSMTTTNIRAQTLVWSDEFNYSGLPDSNFWGNEVGYIRNNELQYYTDRDLDNQVVRNGNLELIALRESFQGFAYTSASINTKGKLSVNYGKIEARMKLPMGQGLWPAFWTLGINIDTAGWPACGEIDIMEHVNNEMLTYGTAHWAGNGGKHVSSGGSFSLDPAIFHVYSIIWDSSVITWFVDGAQYYQLNIAGGQTSELQLPQYLLLNLAVGGNWPGSPDATTVFPATTFIDYVRIYDMTGAPPPPPPVETCPTYSGPNLVLNGGFESGLTSWKVSTGTAVSQTANALCGSYSAKLGGNARNGLEQTVTGLQPNTTYTLKVQGKVSVSGVNGTVGVKNFGGTTITTSVVSTSYVPLSITFTTGSSSTSAVIYGWNASGNYIYLDAFHLAQ